VGDVSTLKEYLPLIGVAVCGLLVIIGGLYSNTWLEYFRKRKLRRTLALSFKGEVQALLKMIEERGYIEGLRKAKAHIEATGKFQAYQVRAQNKHFSVFEASIGQIGILKPPLADLLCRFYSQTRSILEGMERFDEFDPDTVDPVVAIAAYDEVLNIFEDTVTVGNRIIQEVSRYYL
jgi:hypothetical protein